MSWPFSLLNDLILITLSSSQYLLFKEDIQVIRKLFNNLKTNKIFSYFSKIFFYEKIQTFEVYVLK